MQTNLNKKCDLHIHSIFSDSDSTVEDIFLHAHDADLSCIAICDHDTVAGFESAQQCSQRYGIEILPAIEISAQKNDAEVHILGYLFDPKSPVLLDSLKRVQETRRERIVLMIEKLKALGAKVDKDELFGMIKNSVPTRLHLGLYMVRQGVVNTIQEAFRKYLSPGKPAYVSRFKYSVEESIRIIKDSGGLSFIAHPYILSDQSWIEEFAKAGIDGLEVVYPRLSKEKIAFYERMADGLKLLKSGGSDAHGSFKEYTQIGSVSIQYSWIEAMKARLAQAHR
jgi:3',5'-nucleoside bisphosphate phosphatase